MTLNRERQWTHESVLGSQDGRDSPRLTAGRLIEQGSEANVTAIRCQTESTLRHRPRHPKEGGTRALRSLPIYHQALAQKKAPHRGGDNPQDPWQALGERQSFEAVAP